MATSLDIVTRDLGSRLGVPVCLRSCFNLSEMKFAKGRREGRHARKDRMALMLARFFLLFGCLLNRNEQIFKYNRKGCLQDSRKGCFVLTTNNGHVNLDTGPDEDIGKVCSQTC